MNASTWESPSSEPTKMVSSEKTICIGIGTAGCRIGTEIVSAKVPIHQFLMVSTDKEDFSDSQQADKILVDLPFRGRMSVSSIRGLAHSHLNQIRNMLSDAGVVIIVSGLGGAVGSALTPAISQIVHDCGKMLVAVVVMPFKFEKSRHFYSALSLNKLKKLADAVIAIDNDMFLEYSPRTPLLSAYAAINTKIVAALSALLTSTTNGPQNVGLAKVAETNSSTGYSVLGLGSSTALNRVEAAVMEAIQSVGQIGNIDDAESVILHLSSDASISTADVASSVAHVHSLLGRGKVGVQYGLSTNSKSSTTAVLLASGLSRTKFDSYDPLSEVLKGKEIDDSMDSFVDESLPRLTLLE